MLFLEMVKVFRGISVGQLLIGFLCEEGEVGNGINFRVEISMFV